MSPPAGSSPRIKAPGRASRPALPLLQQEIARCTICDSMKPWRRFGPAASGTADTGYLLVGEAPGYVSWKQGRRFTGPAGLLIRRSLARLAHPRFRDLEDLFYMTDAVKCHPAARANPSANRSPRRAEIRACAGHLSRELAILKPSVVVTFGKAAERAVAEAVGQEAGLRGLVRLVAFPHPSPRNRRTILQAYPSMAAFELAIAMVFRKLIRRLEISVKREDKVLGDSVQTRYASRATKDEEDA
jgi:uracil-DNA glycosylase family 4